MDITVSSAMHGMTIKHLLLHEIGLSQTQLKSAKWSGTISLNGIAVTVRTTVSTGDLLRVEFPASMPKYPTEPFQFPLKIPYEDEHMLIVDKPAPLASQSSHAYPNDSLENAVFQYLGKPHNFVYRPVNRLDKGTSGLMVIAKSAFAQYRLQSILHSSSFHREYTALVHGTLSPLSGIINLPIGMQPGSTIKRMVQEDGKPSTTRYQVLEQSENGLSLVHLSLVTGRTHQIRVHLSTLGCPVFGDFLYGHESPLLPGRFALHSSELTLMHPIQHVLIHIASPVPSLWHQLLEHLPENAVSVL